MSAPASTPASTFYRRPLPAPLVAFASPEGRRIFQEALAEGGMEGWFAVAEQFHTQSDPAFCGLGTLVVALNALEIDPGRVWKGPWRWYAEELLDCCLPLEEVRAKGLTLDELGCLARCNGARVRLARAEAAPLAELREAVRAASTAARGTAVVAGHSRRALDQTGDGRFSPIALILSSILAEGFAALAIRRAMGASRRSPATTPGAIWRWCWTWRGSSTRRTGCRWSGCGARLLPADPATGRSRGWLVLERAAVPVALYFRLAPGSGAERAGAALWDATPSSARAPAADLVAALEDVLGDLFAPPPGG